MSKLPGSREKLLLREKDRLENLIPLVSPSRSNRLVRQLARINARLGLPTTSFELGESQSTSFATSASGINGIGGLRFLSETPPGRGRLVRLPFYLTRFDTEQAADPVVGGVTYAKVYTAGGANAPSPTSPVVVATVPTQTGVRVVHSMYFQTPQIEWARFRLVGFQARGLAAPVVNAGATPAPGADFPPGSAVYTSAPVPFLLVRDLMLNGSANLFCQDGYQDAAYFNGGLPYLTGLRAYPQVGRTDVVSVSAAVAGSQGSSLTFNLCLVAEIEWDAELGRAPSAPYVARDSLSRIRQSGQLFIRD